MKLICLMMMAACAGNSAAPAAASKGPRAANEQILDAGGKLPAAFPLQPVEVTPTEVLCYGFAEGPANSSLEDLSAKASQQAREDYGQFIGVLMQHLDLQLQAAGQEGAQSHEAMLAAEKTNAVPLGPPEQSWQKVERDFVPVLRVFVRYHVARAQLQKALAAGIPGRSNNDAIADRTLSGMARK